ncbi:MAG: hypothetical protein ACO201_04645 [Rickettsiales bacterium]
MKINPIEVRAKCAERMAGYVYAKPKDEKARDLSPMKDMAELIREARIRAGLMQAPLHGELVMKQVGFKKSL